MIRENVNRFNGTARQPAAETYNLDAVGMRRQANVWLFVLGAFASFAGAWVIHWPHVVSFFVLIWLVAMIVLTYVACYRQSMNASMMLSFMFFFTAIVWTILSAVLLIMMLSGGSWAILFMSIPLMLVGFGFLSAHLSYQWACDLHDARRSKMTTALSLKEMFGVVTYICVLLGLITLISQATR